VSFSSRVDFSCVPAIQAVVESNFEIISSLGQMILLTEVLEMREESVPDVEGVVSEVVVHGFISNHRVYNVGVSITIAHVAAFVALVLSVIGIFRVTAGTTLSFTVRVIIITIEMLNETLNLKISHFKEEFIEVKVIEIHVHSFLSFVSPFLSNL